MAITNELDELLKLAKAATQGELRVIHSLSFNHIHLLDTQVKGLGDAFNPIATIPRYNIQGDYSIGDANAAFYAAANPQVVKQLIGRIRELEVEREMLQAERQALADSLVEEAKRVESLEAQLRLCNSAMDAATIQLAEARKEIQSLHNYELGLDQKV